MSEALDLLTITTPLPDTSFVVGGISGSERLSRPYGYTVQLHSGQELLDPDSLLDNPVAVLLAATAAGSRYFCGIVRAVRQMPSQSKLFWDYEISVVPKLWFLGQTRDVRFYQKQTVPEIVEEILSDFSVVFSDKLTKSYPQLDYVVMFNESYLAFIQRLLEQVGIFYFFEQDESGDTLVLADANTAFADIEQPDVELDETNGGYGMMSSWHQEDHTVFGVVRTDDYNPETGEPVPGAITGSETTVLTATGAPNRKYYDWPAVSTTTSDAAGAARIRMLAAEAAAQIFTGQGEVLDFVAGGKFTLTGDPTGTGSYVIQSVSYHVTDTADGAGQGLAGSLSMSVAAFPAATEWHEEPSVMPPVMDGIYSAKVIGAAGEEIYTDDLGRIQVQFPADHNGDITTEKTLFVRVVQPWAGDAWGAHFIPRIGMEVAVAFLEGDVNRPVVIGALVNTNNPPVFAKTDKNKTGFRTRSTMNGGADNFNELSWDDSIGSEVFFLHAEKDYTLEVENDATYTIDHDRAATVKNDETVTIQGKKTDTITGDYATTVQQGNASLTVSEGDQAVEVTAGNINQTAGQSINLKVAANTLVINDQGITLTVGGNSIQITESGITIKGIMVDVEGNAQTSVKGAVVQVQGEGMLDMSGAVTMINS